MGDFNAKRIEWNCFSNNARGRDLLKLCLRNNVTIVAPVMPTHYPKVGKPSILDFFITKNIKNNSDALALQMLSSDHNPVILKLTDKPTSSHLIEILDYNNANWENFKNELNLNIDLNFFIKKRDELELVVNNKKKNKFNNIISNNIKNNIPSKKTNVTGKPIPSRIKQYIKIKNNLRRKYQNNHSSKNKNNLELMQLLVNKKNKNVEK